MLLVGDVIAVVVLAGLLWIATRLRPSKTRRIRSVGSPHAAAPERTTPPERHVAPPPFERVNGNGHRNDPAAESIAPTEEPPAIPAPIDAPLVETVAIRVRRPVVVAPRGAQWIVKRAGASRASSVHDTREAAVARARTTAMRERVPLDVRETEVDADQPSVDA